MKDIHPIEVELLSKDPITNNEYFIPADLDGNKISLFWVEEGEEFDIINMTHDGQAITIKRQPHIEDFLKQRFHFGNRAFSKMN